MRALLFISLVLLFCSPITAQKLSVQGENYKIADQPGGPVITWNGRPATPEQLITPNENEIRLLDPTSGEEQVVIFLTPDGQIRKVIDLAYSSVTEADYAEQRKAETNYQNDQVDKRAGLKKIHPITITDNSFALTGELEVKFKNGLVFQLKNGKAEAYLGTEKIEVIGESGRYRIETTNFEAGVAFDPSTGKKVYKYLTVR